jgi:NAD(P)-dependent dehydrogenase (short-subunit alcohol dehydrogenase family)
VHGRRRSVCLSGRSSRALRWSAPELAGKVAVVTGSSRGVGRGIARVLGESGATVYVTGRSDGVEAVAGEVTERGGRGVPVRTDHTDAARVAALFERVRAESGSLDLLVANAWGGYEDDDAGDFGAPFWEQPVRRWDVMHSTGLRATYLAVRQAAPLLIERGRGLIVLTAGWDDPTHYLGSLPYDTVKTATARMVRTMAHELRPHGVAVVGVYPGFTRTERVVEAFAKQGQEPPAETHSTEFVGRAVASVLADPENLALSGSGAQAATYARRYGFTDTDGREIAPFLLPDTLRLRTSAPRGPAPS